MFTRRADNIYANALTGKSAECQIEGRADGRTGGRAEEQMDEPDGQTKYGYTEVCLNF